MDGRETQLSSSSTKYGGWITLPFIIGQPPSLSLSLSLSNTQNLFGSIYFLFLFISRRGGSRLHTWRRGMDFKLDRISDSGVHFEKHKCCSDFKHSEWYISYFYLYQEGAAVGFTLGGGGWISNLIIYLIQVFTLKNINAAQISNIVSGSTNLLPVIGAIVADSFFGTFSVAAVSVCISLLGHKCFSCYRTYVMILCNWLILWQNALCLYLGRLRMCLTTSRNHVSRSSVEAFKSVQKIKQKCKFIKARQMVDTCSTPPICRGLRISYFNSDFLRIRESVYGPSFLLTLDI